MQYDGDVEKYLKQLTDLLLYHPVNPKVSLTLAIKPFGDELVYRMQDMNDLYGGTGMSTPQLITQIKNFVLEKESSPEFTGWRRQGRDSPIKRVKTRVANVPQPKTTAYPPKTNNQYSPPPPRPPRRDQTPNTPPRDLMAPRPNRPKPFSPTPPDQKKPKEVGERTFIKVRYGEGPTPCFVCGSFEHPWIFCEKKARGKCAMCGSRAHPTRLCAQRYQPRPEVRIHSAQITLCMRDDPQYIFTNMPDSEAEDDNATEVELSADKCDSEDEIEEVMGNTVSVRPLREVEDEEDMKSIEWNWHFSSNWAGAFRASIASYTPNTLQLSLDQSTGILPAVDPDQCGQLIYPISLEGHPTTALLDHGVSTCFLSKKWAHERGLTIAPLKKPLHLVEFTGTSGVLNEQAKIAEVSFVGLTRPLSFMLSPHTPSTIVIGLDLIRSWPINYNPANDHLISVLPTDPRNLALSPPSSSDTVIDHMIENHENPDPEMETEEVDISCPTKEEYPPSHTPSLTLVFPSKEIMVKAYDQTNPEAWSNELNRILAVMEEDANISLSYHSVHCHSVTAGTEAERDALRSFIAELPTGLKAIIFKYPRLFSLPGSVPPPREVSHHIKLKPDVVPVRRPPYPLGDAKLAAMLTQVKELADQQWISPSCSPWGAPILFIKKKEGE